MIRILVVCLACLSLPSALPASGNDLKNPIPLINAVDPDITKVNLTATATGTSLDQSAVASLYMIQDEKTLEVKITSQTEDAIKFVVPDSAKPGKYRLMVLTKGAIPQYVEEPVFLTVE